MAYAAGIRTRTRPADVNAPIPENPPNPASRLLVGQKEILEGIVAGRSLADLLYAICQLVEAQTENMLCSVLLLDSDGIHVRHGAAPSLPAEFVRAIDGAPIGPTAGSCGTAAYRGEAVIVEDIATDPLWQDYRHLALPHGLQACWSTPVFDRQRRVLGTFAIYYRHPRKPAPEHAALIEMATQTAAIAIEHHRVLENLRENEERFRQMAENIRDVFWLTDPAKNTMLYVSPAYETIWGRSCESLQKSPRTWLEAIHPEDRDRVIKAAAWDQSTGNYEQEYRIVRPDGTLRWIRDQAFPVRNANGAIYRIAGIAEDITKRREAEAEMRCSNERFLLVSRATNDAVWDWDFAQNTLWWNESFTTLFGYSLEEIEPGPESWTLRIHPEELDQVTADFHRIVDGSENSWAAEYRFRRKDGSYADIFDRGFVIRDAAGKAVRMIGAMQDITQRKQAEKRIKRQNRVYAMLSGITTLIVRVHDRQKMFDEVCRIAAEQGGFGMVWIGLLDRATGNVKPAAWAGFEVDDEWGSITASARDDAGGQGVTGRAIRSGKPEIINDIVQDQRPSSKRRTTAITRGFRSVIALPLFVDNEVVGNFSLYAREADFFDVEEVRLLTELAGDISFALQYIAKEEKANHLAYYDATTGLPNRTLFLEHLSHALHVAGESAGKFVLVLGDVKRFRMINNTLGRQAGDEVLKQVAGLLRRLVSHPENLARVSGDCFATFLPAIRDLTEVVHRIENLATEGLRKPVSVAGRDLALAFTIGAAVFPEDGADAETLFRNAEAALKKAKASGERYLFYAPEMNARVAESLTLENKLRRALDLGQFVLHYQPKVDVRTRALTGLEALIRWQDPELGLVPPAEFIPLMEETGLILEVGRWALQQAVSDHCKWTGQGLRPPRIAVNVSSIQLRQKNFVDTVAEAIGGFGGKDVALDLEITESVMMENLRDMTKALQIISDLGVRIAMDDFGTGYSSLSYIAKLPINELKIDRSFVIDMTGSEYSRNIVTMIIQLAHTLRLKVVAEGVDAEDQVHILDRLGCDQMQGYLISKPLPPAEIERLLEKSRAT
jgi:diguanylate cyclase (GGDEF)-like protein/PAS domain S-box-containing protein